MTLKVAQAGAAPTAARKQGHNGAPRAQSLLKQRGQDIQALGTITRLPIGPDEEACWARAEVLNQILADTLAQIARLQEAHVIILNEARRAAERGDLQGAHVEHDEEHAGRVGIYRRQWGGVLVPAGVGQVNEGGNVFGLTGFPERLYCRIQNDIREGKAHAWIKAGGKRYLWVYEPSDAVKSGGPSRAGEVPPRLPAAPNTKCRTNPLASAARRHPGEARAFLAPGATA
jgi:hypothetical protein